MKNMTKSESLSFSTGNDDHEVVDMTSNMYAAWAVEVTEHTAYLIARWQRVRFTHGVLNTGNMSVLGLTVDYGPFGFLDAFDPSFTPNTTDLPGKRYCFANQPDIDLWNITQYGGLPKYNKQLISKLLSNMAVDKVDYTNGYRTLSNVKADPNIPEDELLVPLKYVLLDIDKERKEAWIGWVKTYIHELASGGVPDEERKASMDAVNPKYVLRNYLCQSAIDAAEKGDDEKVRRLLKLMERDLTRTNPG